MLYNPAARNPVLIDIEKGAVRGRGRGLVHHSPLAYAAQAEEHYDDDHNLGDQQLKKHNTDSINIDEDFEYYDVDSSA